MKKRCKTIDKEMYNDVANKLFEIKSIVKAIIIIAIEFDYGLLPLIEILNNRIDDAVNIINK